MSCRTEQPAASTGPNYRGQSGDSPTKVIQMTQCHRCVTCCPSLGLFWHLDNNPAIAADRQRLKRLLPHNCISFRWLIICLDLFFSGTVFHPWFDKLHPSHRSGGMMSLEAKRAAFKALKAQSANYHVSVQKCPYHFSFLLDGLRWAGFSLKNGPSHTSRI